MSIKSSHTLVEEALKKIETLNTSEVKDLIEKGGSRTNISNYVNKGNLVNIEPPKIEYVLQDQNSFLGYATPETYKFTFVTSTEELITEFKTSSRGPTSTSDDAIGGLFIYATKKFTGPPEKANAEALQRGVKKVYLRSGLIYLLKTHLLKINTLIGKKSYPIITPKSRSLNIDYILDF